MPIKNWTLALYWADDKNEEGIDECFNKDIYAEGKPRISATSSAMNQVEFHFKNEEISESTLNLYQKLLGCTRPEVLAFLKSINLNTVEDMFYDMPSDMISTMKGRPCRARDHEKLLPLKLPSRTFSKCPTLLVSNLKETALYVRGKEIQRISKGGLLVALPTINTLEQFAVICNNGPSTLLSVTRTGIIETCDFDLILPEGEETIDWIDSVTYNDHIILFWGGTDALRGQSTWVYSTALDPTGNELFYELENADKNSQLILKDSLQNHDYTKHGNLLTLWKRFTEVELDGQRHWNQSVSVNTSTHLVLTVPSNTTCVWGSPQHFVLSDTTNKITTYLCGIKQNEFSLNLTASSMCVLYSHSK